MALRTSEDDQANNPGQADYENKFVVRDSAKNLDDAEKVGSKNSNDNINDAEQNPDSGWKTNVSNSGNKQPSKLGGFGRVLRKKGPLAMIITIVVGGGFGLTTLLSPGLLLVQIKETMVNKFNTQLTSMNVRTNKLLSAKATGGICAGKLSIACKYSSMSTRELDNFKAAGIKVNYEKTSVFGQAKPTSFEFKGQTITANEFSKTLKSSTEFSAAVKNAYNPKFAGFADKFWTKAGSWLKISKKAPVLDGADYDSKVKNLSENIKDTTGLKETPKLTGDDINPNTDKPFKDGPSDALKKANENIDELNDLIKASGGNGSATSKILNGSAAVASVVKITGILDDTCSIYRTFQALGYAAKTVRVVQLAAFAMLFLNVADQIKAGSANPDDVSLLGTMLTNESTDDYGNKQSATDSFGYKYSAYGDTGDMPTSSMQFMAAAGLSGVMIGFFQAFPAVSKTTCRVLGNTVVGFASLAIGATLAFFSGGVSTAVFATVKAAGKAALRSPAFWTGVGLGFAETFLPSLLKDIVAGDLVDETTVGAYAGDALTSGASGIMGSVAKAGGNAPMKPTEAVAYSNLSKEIAMQYAEEERLTASPFDATNSNTFIGSIVAQLLPYSSRLSSLSGTISSIASLALNSFSSIINPSTHAASSEEYSLCQDKEYRDMNLATDPFCNVIYGIPPSYLEISPFDVIDELLKEPFLPQIDSETGEPLTPDEIKAVINEKSDADHSARVEESYYDFVQKCINRSAPLGDTTELIADGEQCMIGNNVVVGYLITYDDEGNPHEHAVRINNKYFYLHYIDQRVQNGMDGTDTTLAAALESGRTDISFFDMGITNSTALNSGGSY